jgi:hypothetical protein
MNRLSGHRKRTGLAATALFLLLFMAVYVTINNRSGTSAALFDEKNGKFTLQPGDILARPNLNWLPGSSKVSSGRKFGHAAIVVQGATGNNPDEALQKALVVEAFFFDQATRRFVFSREKQVRLAPARISFGNRFTGIRYRLRMPLDPQQQEMITIFLNAQIGKCRYKIFSDTLVCTGEKGMADSLPTEDCGWNCATLIGYSFCRATGINLDANQGIILYPNDIINSPVFNSSEGRLRF